MPNRRLELQAMLQGLRLPTMAEVCADLALKAAKEGLSHEAFLYELARLESERREQQRIERLLAQSGLPREKTFATFQLDRLPMPIRAHIRALAHRGVCQGRDQCGRRGSPGCWEKSRTRCSGS